MNSELLDEMRSEMAEQSPLHRPTPFWDQALRHIGDEIRGSAIDQFRRIPSVKDCFVPTYQLESLAYFGADYVDAVKGLPFEALKSQKGAALIEWLSNGAFLATSDYRAFIAGDRPELVPQLSECSESTVGDPDEQWVFEGRRYSRSMLNYLNGLVFLKQHVDTSSITKVLEIGGGFGTLGEILLKAPDRDYTYVDVDIPPAAFAASYYLSSIYPEGAFADFIEAKNWNVFQVEKLKGRAAVICPWQLEKIEGSFDLLVNFISFQEMEPNVVENYLDHMKRLGCKFALIRNLREGRPKRSESRPFGVEDPILGKDYDQMFERRGYGLVATNVYPFGFKTVDGFHSELRLYERLGT